MKICEHVTCCRRVNLSTLLLAAVFALQFAVSSANATTPADEAATQVAEEYVAALQTGDVDTIKALLAGQYLERHRRQLESEGYPQRLTKLYGASRYRVLRAETGASQSASVDVAVRFPSGEEDQWRLLLKQVGIEEAGAPIYRVVGEEEPRD